MTVLEATDVERISVAVIDRRRGGFFEDDVRGSWGRASRMSLLDESHAGSRACQILYVFYFWDVRRGMWYMRHYNSPANFFFSSLLILLLLFLLSSKSEASFILQDIIDNRYAKPEEKDAILIPSCRD